MLIYSPLFYLALFFELWLLLQACPPRIIILFMYYYYHLHISCCRSHTYVYFLESDGSGFFLCLAQDVELHVCMLINFGIKMKNHKTA